MCLAVPAKIIAIDNNEAEIDFDGIIRHISICLTPEALVGDYVLVHTGFAINIVQPDEAENTLALLSEITKLQT